MGRPRGSKNGQRKTREIPTISRNSTSIASQEAEQEMEQEETIPEEETPEEATIPTEKTATSDDVQEHEVQEQATGAPLAEPTSSSSLYPTKPAGMRSLKCVLTEDERSEYGMALAQFVTELEALEAQKANLPSQIKGVRERMRDTKSAMQNGFEYRDIDVFERDNGATIEIVRADTGEVVDVRAAKLDDKQLGLYNRAGADGGNPLDGEETEDDEDETAEPYSETEADPESEVEEPESDPEPDPEEPEPNPEDAPEDAPEDLF